MKKIIFTSLLIIFIIQLGTYVYLDNKLEQHKAILNDKIRLQQNLLNLIK